MKRSLAALLLSASIVAAAGCGRGRSGADLTVAGSTSIQPFADKWAEVYMKLHPSRGVNVQGGGSSAGIQACKSGACLIGMSSRELKPDEKDLTEVVVARDGLAIVVHPSNPVRGVSLDQVKQIVQEMAQRATPQEPGAAELFAAAEGHGFSYALDILRAAPGEALHETARAWNRFELKTRLGDLLGKAILYVFALLVGWTTLYLAAPTFGAKPDDYIALFLWGAAANIVGGQSINLASIWQKRRAEGEAMELKPEG